MPKNEIRISLASSFDKTGVSYASRELAKLRRELIENNKDMARVNSELACQAMSMAKFFEVDYVAEVDKAYRTSGGLDPCGSRGDRAGMGFTQINATYSVETAVETVAGTPDAAANEFTQMVKVRKISTRHDSPRNTRNLRNRRSKKLITFPCIPCVPWFFQLSRL
ncbi:MAG: hypothetical protein IJR99_01260 [Kiritimatiellae bacterium]|nr:hypothetical protein [Kiritimatiellia bacterium]